MRPSICGYCTFSTGEGTILFCSFHGGKAIGFADTCGSFVVKEEAKKIYPAPEEVPEEPRETGEQESPEDTGRKKRR